MKSFHRFLAGFFLALAFAVGGRAQLTGSDLTVNRTTTYNGVATPATLSASVNDYAPANFSTSETLRLSTSATWNITGIAGGGAGMRKTLFNVGSNPLVLVNQSSSSAAANRFDIGGNITLPAHSPGVQLTYDATAGFWRIVGGPTTGGAGDASTTTSVSVDGEVALFSGTGGKTIKRATGTGIASLTAGVLGTATAGTDYLAPAAIGVTLQAYNANLAALAAVSGSANQLPYFTSSSAMGVTTLSAFGRSLIDDVDATSARTTLGAAPKSSTFITQTVDTSLTGSQALSALSSGIITVTTGTGVLASFNTSAGLAAILTDETGTGANVFGTSPTIATPIITGAITFTAGTRQTFAPSTTTPGFNVGSVAGDPSTPSNGDLWYDSTGNLLRARAGGASFTIAVGGGSGTVTHTVGALTANFLVVGNAAADVDILSSLGTTTTVLHGNASGRPTFGAVNLASDVTGNLPIANIASGSGASSSTYLRGDNTWATPGGSGTVTASGGTLTANSVILGAGTTDTKVVAGITSDGTSKLVLGVAGTSVGSIDLKNATSGTLNLAPATGALGTSNWVFPIASDTVVGLAATQTLTNKTLSTSTSVSAALSFTAGVRQTFAPSTTTPGFNVGSVAGDPSTPSNGDLWYDSTGNLLRARAGGASFTIAVGGGSGTVSTGSINQLAYYAAGGTTISGNSAFTVTSAGLVHTTNTTNSTLPTNGSVIIDGGLGVGLNLVMAGIFSSTNTTGASTSLVGAFVVGNGVAATAVSIGNGTINVGGTAVIGGAITSNSTGQLFARTGASTAAQYFQLANTGGQILFGVNDSAHATIGFAPNYASFIYSGNATSLALGANSTLVANLTSANFNIPLTVSATSPIVGSFTIGNGTAATNVGIGGGNINAGGTITAGGGVVQGSSTFNGAALSSTGSGTSDVSFAIGTTAVNALAMGFNASGSTNAFGAPTGSAYVGNANGNPLNLVSNAVVFLTGTSTTVNIPRTVSASSSTTGSLTIGNGTAATNVALGGGRIWTGDFVNVGGNALGAAYGLAITNTVASASAQSRLLSISGTNAPSANADASSGIYINSTIATGTLTGLIYYGISLPTPTKTGTGTIATSYQFYIDAGVAATTKYGIYQIGTDLNSFGGGLVSVNPTAGLGYAVGAGGTVTQSTSKATAFTLSTVSGTITTPADALAAGTVTSATWTNTALGAADHVVISHQSGGTIGAYQVTVGAVTSGSATLYIRNNTGGSLSEALTLKFTVIKGANS